MVIKTNNPAHHGRRYGAPRQDALAHSVRKPIHKKIESQTHIPKEEPVRFVALGGLEEIGRNMMFLEYKEEIIIIDAGLQFAEEGTPGVDYIIPNVSYLEKNPDFGFVHTPVYYIDESDSVLGTSEIYRSCPVGWVAKKLLLGSFVCNSTVIVRKSCFEKSGLFDETIFVPADWDMWLRISEHYKIGYIDQPLTQYRVTDNYTFNKLELAEKEEAEIAARESQKKLEEASKDASRMIEDSSDEEEPEIIILIEKLS